jgi:hypothetical protein
MPSATDRGRDTLSDCPETGTELPRSRVPSPFPDSWPNIDEHAAHLPRGVCWYADLSGAAEIKYLRGAGHRVLRGSNAIRAGIAAVAARTVWKTVLQEKKVLRPACPNLLDEAGMYHYAPRRPGEPISETPVDLYNHALGAVRYIVSKIDAAFLARFARNHPSPLTPLPRGERGRSEGGAEETEAHDTEAAESMTQVVNRLLRRQTALPADDEGLWEPLN